MFLRLCLLFCFVIFLGISLPKQILTGLLIGITDHVPSSVPFWRRPLTRLFAQRGTVSIYPVPW